MKRILAVLAAVVLLVTPASALSVEQAIELLEERYIQNLPPAAYEAESLEELFALLGDPYTYYMTEEEYDAFLNDIEVEVDVVGIGASIRYTEQGIEILSLLPGGSAQAMGLMPGDLIVAIDGVPCAPADESHRALMVGEEGTTVVIKYYREGQYYVLPLTRTRVVIRATQSQLRDGRVGYIKCSSFALNTGEDFADAVWLHGSRAQRWLVDIRGNTGGYADAAADALGVFSGPGVYLYMQSGNGNLYITVTDQEDKADQGLVVLVDGDSASAAEAFAAGVRDLSLGIVVGSRTFGKGIAQIVLDETTHPDYFDGDGLKLTAYRFYSFDGITNHKLGVIPTLLVEDEYAEAIAMALCGSSTKALEELPLLQVGGHIFPMDLEAMDPAARDALMAALPPSALIWTDAVGRDRTNLTIPEITGVYGKGYGSRWMADVAGSSFGWYINTLATYGLVEGDGAGNFYPFETMKRGEVCAMLARTLGLTAVGSGYFDDVPADHPYAAAVDAMAEQGLISGVGDGTFRPEGTITQQEYFTILARCARWLNLHFAYAEFLPEDLALAAEAGFAPWAQDGIILLDSLETLMLNGDTPEPNAPILREEAAASLCAMLIAAGILPD